MYLHMHVRTCVFARVCAKPLTCSFTAHGHSPPYRCDTYSSMPLTCSFTATHPLRYLRSKASYLPLPHIDTRHPTIATPTVSCLLPTPLLPPTHSPPYHCNTCSSMPLTCSFTAHTHPPASHNSIHNTCSRTCPLNVGCT